MIEGILTSLAATILVAVFVELYRRGLLREFLDIILYYIKPSGLRAVRSSAPKISTLQGDIVRCLLKDQSRFGIHKGQFGKSNDKQKARSWQNKDTGENITLKPRMYLTFWPTVVMHRHKIARRSVELAYAGIQRLFFNNQVLVAQSAAPNMAPYGKPPMPVSYRHTMAGALVLAEFKPWNSITYAVVDAMLDPKNNWQNESGGWRQVSKGFSGDDLWAGAYAARLLKAALYPSSPFSDIPRDIATKRLERTLFFLQEHWEREN
jgi:hypothetical protein